MQFKALSILIVLIAVIMAPSAGLADADSRVLGQLTLEVSPLDMSTSKNGKWIYLLTAPGDLLIYSSQGRLNGKIDVGRGFDQVESGATEDQVYLLNRKEKRVQVVEISYTFDIDTSRSPYKGPIDAPVVIVEYTDFQCPYCARLGATLDLMMKLYPGKIKVVYKSFPLSSHKYSWQAATTAMAASQNGKFWEVYKEIFSNYNQITEAKLKEIREHFGLDTPEFDALMNSPEIRSQVASDRNEGIELGVEGTPTVFINGKLLKNKRPDGFKEAIDKALETAGR
jgi:protein-disulfide isomerase